MVHMVVTVDVVTVADADQKHANSCRSLQLQGITGSNLTIDNHGVPTIMDCTNLTGGRWWMVGGAGGVTWMLRTCSVGAAIVF